MRTRRRTNLLWGLVLLAVALAVTLHALQLIPASIYDLLLRAWPVLLVLAGLSILLRPRVIFGSGIALILSAVLVGGVMAVAFSTRSAQQRSDYTEPVLESIGPQVTLLRVQIRTLSTDVELLQRVGTDRVVTGQFVGSAESQVIVNYTEDNVVADLTVTEQQVNPFPVLENVGRGTCASSCRRVCPLILTCQGHRAM